MLAIVKSFNMWLISWPFFIFIIGTAFTCSLLLKFVQIRQFAQAWKWIFAPVLDESSDTVSDMNPLQAFMTTLSANLGNGSLAGMASAIYAGGPGAAIWVLLIGFFLMAVRYSEVYLGVLYSKKDESKGSFGGPMLYLRDAFFGFGPALAWLYGLLCLLFSFLIGNALQTNSIRISLETTFGMSSSITAVLLGLFIAYILLGGAKRVARFSDAIVPLKVGVFVVVSIGVLGYHWDTIIPSLWLMITSAFSASALFGGTLGFTVAQAMRYGILRSIYATEAGLGTAAIMYSSTGSDNPKKEATISMLSTFISTLVCFVIALSIVASGALVTGLNSTDLTIAAYEPTFGAFAGWIVSFLSVSFGIGVLVVFAYVTKKAWLSVTGGRFEWLFGFVFVAVGMLGALIDATTVFEIGDTINVLMLLINMSGILFLIKRIAAS